RLRSCCSSRLKGSPWLLSAVGRTGQGTFSIMIGMSAPFLDVVDLRKNYGSTVALAGVSFQVAEGEIFGLLGPNGAGKTTLLSILSCLLEATGGAARLLGRPIRRGDRAMRRLIGVVPQELALYG